MKLIILDLIIIICCIGLTIDAIIRNNWAWLVFATISIFNIFDLIEHIKNRKEQLNEK